jgi:crotonobetainyl-CoA:carnitine CoA-transferase CaiB-like acyl-CoA transferase
VADSADPVAARGALAGLRVVDVSTAVAGPWSTTMLGDHGADVVLVEPVGRYDPMRMTGPTVHDVSGVWVSLNRNKRAIAVNLRDPRGRDLVFRLAAAADVFVQNLRPGSIDRLGLGYEAVSAGNPEVVYVSISGFGATGPYADQPVYDPVVQGISGLVDIQNGDLVKSIIVDKVTALTTVQAVMAALLARARGHGGQLIEINLLDATIAFLWPDAMWNESVPDQPPVPTYSDWYAPYPTMDGSIAAVWTTQDQYRRAVTVLGRPDLADDPRFATRADRGRNAMAMRAELGALLRTCTTAEAIERLRSADVPCGPVNRRAAVAADPQVVHNRVLVDLEHPIAGRTRVVRPPAHLSKTPATIRRPAPGYGEHTDEVLTELGLGADEIAALRDDGVVA